MLKNIKSTYFVKNIFLYISEKQKLKLVKYNKTFQKFINISLNNYIHFLGKYIIKESNGEVKEYNYNDELLYEGEYLNGKRNGKGKEFYKNGKIQFECEYLNGEKNGKGKEYDDFNGKLRFEGEYINGKEILGKRYDICEYIIYQYNNMNGKGKEHYFDGTVKFEGEYLNGIKKGKGKEYSINRKLIFEGEYLNDKRNGKGKEYNDFNGKLKFEGDYLNNKKWEGKLYDQKNNNTYELIKGKGLIKEWDNLCFLIFEGEYLNGERNGKGKEYYNINGINKLKYEGEYLNGKRNGKGREYYKNGKLKFEGEYLYDFQIKGKYYIYGKLEFEGEYRYNKKWNGKGFDDKGNIIYELINGKGKVREYKEDNAKLIFEGEYLNGKRNGKGKEFFNNGEIMFEGEYLNGERKKGKEYSNYGKTIVEVEYINGKKIEKNKKCIII